MLKRIRDFKAQSLQSYKSTHIYTIIDSTRVLKCVCVCVCQRELIFQGFRDIFE